MPPTSFPFHQVDVFTDEPYFGNPVAVVNCLDASRPAPSQEAMARFSRWTNLSETTFLLPPSPGSGAHYRLKIFTPATELPFAGHPTLGSCYSFLKHLGADKSAQLIKDANGALVQECGIGNVSLNVAPDGAISFAAPPFLRYEAVDDATLERICHVLGVSRTEIIDSRWITNGPPWVGVVLKDAQAVLDVKPRDGAAHKDLYIGVLGAYPGGKNAQGEAVAHEVRAFVFEDVGEDPVTGSLNAGFAMWLEREGKSPARYYVNSQGTALGRKGRVTVRMDDAAKDEHGHSKIWVGGQCVLCIDGTVNI